jgi:heparanase
MRFTQYINLIGRFLTRRLRRDSRPRTVKVSLTQATPIHSVSPCYLSFSIDISVLAGGFWWEGSSSTQRGLGAVRVTPLNLESPKLNRLTRALSPAYLRIGGSEADKIHYFSAPAEQLDSLVLHRHTWDSLHEFVIRNQLKLAFTVKYGLFHSTQHGHWQSSELEELLRYSQEKNYCIDACELGNELNAYWAFHGMRSQPRAHHLAADYRSFAKIIRHYQPNARIFGPGSAFWPHLGETNKPFSNITERFLQVCQQNGTPLDIVDWHYYAFQSKRSPLRTRTASIKGFINPRALNDFKKYSMKIRIWRDQYFPTAQIWMGESGSAQCGGQAKLSDRFISCFWWADQLGQGAREQQSVMIRQSLVGGDYGLIDRVSLKPRPDFWLSWLWKQLMGEGVYAVSAPHSMLRAYCHEARNPHEESKPFRKCLMLINLSERSLTVEASDFGVPQKQFTLRAKRLKSKRVYINGIKARFRRGQVCLDDFPQRSVNYKLAKYSIHFWLYD